MAQGRRFSDQLRHGGTALGVLAIAAVVLLSTSGHSGGSRAASASAAPVSAPPALRPPKMTVLHRSAGLAPGLIFLGAKDLSPSPGEQGGPLIVDERGRPVWFNPLPPGQVASDFRVQRYRAGRSSPGGRDGASAAPATARARA